MDVAGLVISCADLVQRLYAYGKAVKGAHEDIRKLTTDLLGFSAVLNEISTSIPSLKAFDVYAQVETTACEVIAELTNILNVKDTKAAQAWAALRWPSRKADVDRLCLRLRTIKADLMLCMLKENTVGTSKIAQELHTLHLKYDEELSAVRKAAEEARRNQVRERLAGPIDQRRKMLDILRSRHPASGNWFLRGEEFDKWLNADENGPKTLALIGKSGAGKTSLLASAAHFAEDHGATIAICFVAYNEPTSVDALSVVKSVANQLSVACPAILDEVEDHNSNGEGPSAAQMEQRILLAINNFNKPVHIFVDAINESRQSNELLKLLHNLVGGSRNIRILYSNIPYDGLVTQKELSADASTRIVSMAGLNRDIELFVDHELGIRPSLSKLSTGLRQDIREALTKRAESSFRYVQCQIEHLAAQPTGKLVRAALKDLPSDLNSTYAALLARIPLAVEAQAKEILLWLTFAYKPLSLEALNEIVAFEAEDRSIDPEGYLTCELSDIPRWFGGLIAPAAGSSTGFALAHSSVRTFLTSEAIHSDFGGSAGTKPSFYALDSEQADRHLFRKGLAYMNMSPFRDGPPRMRFRDLYALRPLTIYVCGSWARHAAAIQHAFTAEDTARVIALADTARQTGSGAFGAWVHCLNAHAPHYPGYTLQQTTPLYYFASYGLTAVIPALLKQPGIDLDAPGGRYGARPVVGAVFRQRWDVARILAEAGARPPSVIRETGSCVHAGSAEFYQDADSEKRSDGRQDLREQLKQARSLDAAAVKRGDACLRKVNVFCCGCVASTRSVVHVELCGDWPSEDIVMDIGYGCSKHHRIPEKEQQSEEAKNGKSA